MPLGDIHSIGGEHFRVGTTQVKNINIIHGWSDEIIPVEHSIKYAQQAKCALHLIAGDHRLNTSIEQVKTLFKAFLLSLKQITNGWNVEKPKDETIISNCLVSYYAV